MKKYWIDCNVNSGSCFILYKEDGESLSILRVEYDDIDGVLELERAGLIGEAWEKIDAFIKEKLGFLPDYQVG